MDSIIIVGIDPGPETMGFAMVEIQHQSLIKIILFSDDLTVEAFRSIMNLREGTVIIEDFEPRGQMVNKTFLDTCKQIGRIQEIIERRCMPYQLVKNRDVRKRVSGHGNTPEKVCRDKLISRLIEDLGQLKGTKKNPGVLYGCSLASHGMSALMNAIAWADAHGFYQIEKEVLTAYENPTKSK